MQVLILVALWLLFLFLTFRFPGSPRITRLFFFLCLLAVSMLLGYFFLVQVMKWDPYPTRWRLAHLLTEDKIIDLNEIVPNVPHPNYIHRIDPDGQTRNGREEEKRPEDWLVFYQYDVVGAQSQRPRGPFGAAIYAPDRCRPPVIHSFELVPVNYDYLGQDNVTVEVANIIEYNDPLSSDRFGNDLDRPEVIISGLTRGVVTDLNIFRKVGTDEECVPRKFVQVTPVPGQLVISPFGYRNIGSFRGTYQVRQNGSRVLVRDSAGFERSQIVAERVYTPKAEGMYFRPEAPEFLVEPDSVGLQFGPGEPDETRQVYYPEKTVLAFFLDLAANPDKSMRLVCGGGKGRSEYYPEDFGLTQSLRRLERVAVCELTYNPDIVAEQNHEERIVLAKVEEITERPRYNACKPEDVQSVECIVAAAPNPDALPYGCEWCLLECYPIP